MQATINHCRVYDGVKSFGHYFRNLGYEAALIGKKHFGPPASYPLNYLGGRGHDDGEGIDIDLEKIKPILNQDKPFFLVVASNQPHSPWNRGLAEMYRNKKLEIPEYMIGTASTRDQLARYYGEIRHPARQQNIMRQKRI